MVKNKKIRTAEKKQAKVKKVMGEFEKGSLDSGSKTGQKVKGRKQAIAIAMSEAGMAKKKPKKKTSRGK